MTLTIQWRSESKLICCGPTAAATSYKKQKKIVNKILHGPAKSHARMQESRFLEIAQLQLSEHAFSQLWQTSKKRISKVRGIKPHFMAFL